MNIVRETNKDHVNEQASKERDLILANESLQEEKLCVKISEYRHILKDQTSSDELIKKRLQYIEAFCRNIIELELKKYAQT